jgi:hypothetical protein
MADGWGPAAFFNRPSCCCLALDGSLLVCDTWNHCIRRVALTMGTIYCIYIILI